MKFIFIVLILSISLFSEPLLVQKGDARFWCPISGLNLLENYENSYIAKLEANDLLRQYSSIHSLVVDINTYGLKDIQVYDKVSKNYIDVQKAFFVLAKNKEVSVFSKQADALLHVKKSKGEIISFQKALHVTNENLKSYLLYKKKIHKKRLYPMGKKIYERKCGPSIDPSEFFEIGDLKAELNFTCKDLDEEHLHALAKYMWDIKRAAELGIALGKIEVHKHEKCPICGMFVYKYPRWAAQIHYKEQHFSFDGVKDLMKYYFEHKTDIEKILVSDYYSQEAINGKKAYYVIGSDIYGPMGHELIPFESSEDAIAFKEDHRGTQILRFDAIQKELVYKLDIP